MSVLNENLFTKKFTSATIFEVLAEYGIREYSIKVVSGSATLLGGKTIGDVQSDAIDMVEGDTFTGNSQNSVCCFILTINPASVVQVAAM